MNINNILKEKQTTSFEFFPPKESAQEAVLFDTIESLAKLNPDFVSITYGAGGSSGEKTFNWTKLIQDQYKFTTMMHLTCYGNDPDDIDRICTQMQAAGIDNVLALRGDPPKEGSVKSHFKYANEMVQYIHDTHGDMSIGVAGYPEKHTQAVDLKTDMDNLKRKVDAGADFIITQLFFDNELLYRFRDSAAKLQIDIPIVAGIMPIVGYSQVVRFTQMCGATIPDKLLSRLEKASPEDAIKIGVEHAIYQCQDLIAQKTAGIHYYTLNRSSSVIDVLRQL
ncbi:MAG: methylenetetrahydrofolate reductase [NAD(P)H] [Deferribacteraceae bacterium]|jgi:methylenetetrahydrofolate reductase (NADPH)|nr:methylenetetrahydrofolate reductase [NAD(P)H] [Deferribacteraceae bacterium]